MDIQIAHRTDFPEILEIQKKAFLLEAEFYNNFNIQPLTQTLQEMEEECKEKIVLKAVCEGNIVGSVRAGLNNGDYWINKLVVLPFYQKRGIGEALLRQIEIFFPHADCFKLATGEQSESNIRLYSRVGYRITGKSSFAGGVNAVDMEKQVTILDKINNTKRVEVAEAKSRVSLSELMTYEAYNKKVPSFSEHILSPLKSGIIAEHKRKSPSRGIINGKVQLEEVVFGYENAGASAISVLTDGSYFGGSLSDLKKVTEIIRIPVLRKDFIIDEYQIHEAKAHGAAVILLIAASLTAAEVDRFAKLAHQIGMEVLFEIHNEDELQKLSDAVDVVGVNNRDLKTFQVDIEQSIKLANLIPDRFIKISESGISNPETVKMLKTYGYKGFLMGENFMKETNPGIACKTFINNL
jgi:indole-3-glycerol phosphate synthase